MDDQLRWPVANFCYAGICLVVGLLLFVLGGTNEDLEVLRAIGGFALVIGGAYLVAGLYHLSTVAMGDDRARKATKRD